MMGSVWCVVCCIPYDGVDCAVNEMCHPYLLFR